jgi:hypothetical protein
VKDRLTITHAQVGSIKFEFLGRPEINDVNIVKKEKMNKKVFSPSGLMVAKTQNPTTTTETNLTVPNVRISC